MDLPARKQRWIDFYNRSGASRHLLLVRTPDDGPGRPWPSPGEVRRRIDWAWEQYRRQLERAEWLDDDAIPHLDPFTGTEIFAEAFGCPVQYPEDNMPFALPLVHSAAEADRLRAPGLDAPCLARLFEIADALRERAGAGAVMKLVDIQSPMDIAALIWEKRSFYAALVETPEAVASLASRVRALLVAFLDEWFGRYGRDFVAHYPDYYMPFGITLSEDEIGAVSPRVFEQLFLPELVELSGRYGAIGIHCCAHARHQWEGLLRVPNLRLVNLVQPEPVLLEAYRFFAPHACQMHCWGGAGDPIEWAAARPADERIVVEYRATDCVEALDAVARFRAMG